MLLEPDKPRAKWRGIITGHLILYGLSLIIVVLADSYLRNQGDAMLVFSSIAVFTLISFFINRAYAPRKSWLLTLLLSPGTLLLSFIAVVNMLSLLGFLH